MKESPERWRALLNPPTAAELRQQKHARQLRTLRRRAWFGVIAVVMSAVLLGWLSLVTLAVRPPGMWMLLGIAVWIVALPLMMLTAVAVMAWFGRKVIPPQHQELELES